MQPRVPARLILDEAHEGAWNMAVDEALLASAAIRQSPTLRLYRWREPTLSLGYFQRSQARAEHPSSRDCPLVRRPSGGGAILHDQELTYSFTAPAADRILFDARALYRALHGALVEALAEQKIPAALWETAVAASPPAEPFLCFQRRAEGDIVVDRWKICGSAQRRRKSAVLQHGSLLWRQSAYAPELLGVQDLTADLQDEAALRERWLAGIADRLGLEFSRDPLTAQEHAAAAELEQKKHRRPRWIHRK